MYELFYKTGACSRAVHVLLNEIGTEFTLSAYDADKPDSKLRKVNPRGQVPTLVVGNDIITEGAAIMSWLADEHSSPLLPKSGIARAKALEWLAFGNSSLHPIYGAYFKGGEAFATSEFGKKSEQSLQQLWDLVETQLGKTAYLAGDEITVGDILATVIASWTPRIPAKITLGPKTQAWIKAVESRPAFVKSVEAEQVTKQQAA